MIKVFDFLESIRLRKKNIYFQYVIKEQFIGECWIDVDGKNL